MDPLQQQPQIMYPKSGGIFLMAEVQRLTANVADMIDLLGQKDARIAQLEAQLAAAHEAKATPPGDSNVVQLVEPAAS